MTIFPPTIISFPLGELKYPSGVFIVLKELEDWAKEMGFKKCVLETGKRNPEALALYKKKGYQTTPNYGQYKGIENSVCFEKNLFK